jgi:hypothetical protein
VRLFCPCRIRVVYNIVYLNGFGYIVVTGIFRLGSVSVVVPNLIGTGINLLYLVSSSRMRYTLQGIYAVFGYVKYNLCAAVCFSAGLR